MAQVISASWDHRIGLWNNEPKPRFLHDGTTLGIEQIAVSPSGQWLVSCGGTSRQLCVWDLDEQRVAHRLEHRETVQAPIASGEKIRIFDRHRDIVGGVAFNSVGNRIATASRDGTTKLWDVATGDELLTLTGHIGEVHAVAFSPDGNLLATSGEDGTRTRLRGNCVEVPNLHRSHDRSVEAAWIRAGCWSNRT